MAFDIYGNNLKRGYCEVHPNVHEEYPCSLCISETRRRDLSKSVTQQPVTTISVLPKLMALKLETLKEFQDKYPLSHVGGSIGLMLLGVKLPRELNKSDLDITVDESFDEVETLKHYDKRSDTTDFDLNIEKNHYGGYYTKIDVRVNPEPSFCQVYFNGIKYNVSLLNNILFWKRKYAAKGFQKHIDDLYFIENLKIKPASIVVNNDNNSDLPF